MSALVAELRTPGDGLGGLCPVSAISFSGVITHWSGYFYGTHAILLHFRILFALSEFPNNPARSVEQGLLHCLFMVTKMERYGDWQSHIASKGGRSPPGFSLSIKSTYKRAGAARRRNSQRGSSMEVHKEESTSPTLASGNAVQLASGTEQWTRELG